MKWQAIGKVSKKLYAQGHSKADCMRQLQKDYPDPKAEQGRKPRYYDEMIFLEVRHG